MTKYSVKQLSDLAGVSVRSLHHYDKIGLLSPAYRSEKGYRFYQREELFKLQQILFYKELDFSLKEIAEILNNPDFNVIEGLEFHKAELQKKSKNLSALLATVEKTILQLKSKDKMMTDKEIYDGFTTEEMKSMKEEVTQKWGEKELKETEERIRALGNQGWKDHKKKGEEINQTLADLMLLKPDHKLVQETIAIHHKHMNLFYEVTKERYIGLGKMYTEDERFTAHYNKYKEGLASFLYEAIKIYCA